MKHLPIDRLLTLFFMVLFFTQTLHGQSREKPLIKADIFLLQNGKKFSLKKSKLKLKKAPFSIQVNYTSGEKECLLVNVRTDDQNYLLARSGQTMDIFPASGMAEYPFNPKKELWIENQAYHCWFYTDESNYRYNSVEKTDGLLLATREVENVRFMSGDEPGMPIDQMEGKDLYLTFFQDKSTDYSVMDIVVLGAVKITFK